MQFSRAPAISKTLARAAHVASLLGADEERKLIARAKGGDDVARHRLVMSHLRLAIAAAVRRKGASHEDLVQEGAVGLLEAIDHFNPAQSVRFATYATWWVRNRIWLSVYRSQSIVAMPSSGAFKRMFSGLRTERLKMEREGTKSPAEIEGELARAFRVSPKLVASESSRLGQTDKSLNEPLGHEASLDLIDVLPDTQPLADTHLDDARIADLMHKALRSLDPREYAIVVERNLVDDEDVQTLQVLGGRFKISKERVRQIEQMGLRKLRVALQRAGIGGDAHAM